MFNLGVTLAGYIVGLVPNLFKIYQTKMTHNYALELEKQKADLFKLQLSSKQSKYNKDLIQGIHQIDKELQEIHEDSIVFKVRNLMRPLITLVFLGAFCSIQFIEFYLLYNGIYAEEWGGAMWSALELWNSRLETPICALLGFYFGNNTR